MQTLVHRTAIIPVPGSVFAGNAPKMIGMQHAVGHFTDNSWFYLRLRVPEMMYPFRNVFFFIMFHHEKVVRFFINERKWMKIRLFSEEFRSLLTIAEDSRKNPKMFRTYIIYISESRVQSPESRVQSPESRVQSPESSPVQSPVQILDYAFSIEQYLQYPEEERIVSHNPLPHGIS